MPRRSTLQDYYAELLTLEKVPPCALVAEWPMSLVDQVKSAFRHAYIGAGLAGSAISLEPDSTPQSVGNQVEKCIAARLAPAFTNWQLVQCAGSGYPDRLLRNETVKLPVEIKSTGQWNDSDSNRCVLTSSSTKLRGQFTAPVYHLLVTVKFTRAADVATVRNLRLDFLSPSTPVNVRFEGSVTQKILARALHPIDEF